MKNESSLLTELQTVRAANDALRAELQGARERADRWKAALDLVMTREERLSADVGALAASQPTLFGFTRDERPEAYLWWGFGPDSVTWYVQLYSARAVVDSLEAYLRGIGAWSP